MRVLCITLSSGKRRWRRQARWESDPWGTRRCGILAIAVEETVCPVAVAKLCSPGETLATDIHGVGAARMEATAGGRINQAGNFAARADLFYAGFPAFEALRIGRG